MNKSLVDILNAELRQVAAHAYTNTRTTIYNIIEAFSRKNRRVLLGIIIVIAPFFNCVFVYISKKI